MADIVSTGYFNSLLKINGRPLLIAGPCSAETEDQMLTVAKDLLPLRPALFRAGIWKPRTRPNSFEGVGKIGLEWLQKVKVTTGVQVCTEVSTPHHVEEALRHGIDVLWLGARTTVNPFLVQEIADSLKGVRIPVMVKNPINPELGLWLGALERLDQAGIKDLAAIHRGFSRYGKSVYRNPPTWQIAIDLKFNCPSIPLICDPSHIGGRRDLLQKISQKALDLNYDGLMIETHPDPDRALSDASQQITPHHLSALLDSLILRQPSTQNPHFNILQDELRARIDSIDRELIEIMAERMKVVEKIGAFKKQNAITILQMERWVEIFETRPQWGEALNINPHFIRQIYEMIHLESIRLQTEIMNNQADKSSTN